ncbi:cobalamin B12-binding domain-containing protein [Meridianimarinicoccus aquatilis]|uniref:Cobalamin B12-binding domain-containing protein n=1 Tax=Meridianimarinicoccus aquatilis TaxID=2552766 RepID=A0A4V3BB84_9RHOB|nr:cobalamin B12-binding domain-containing protein [Fluviibacterium aquatile]
MCPMALTLFEACATLWVSGFGASEEALHAPDKEVCVLKLRPMSEQTRQSPKIAAAVVASHVLASLKGRPGSRPRRTAIRPCETLLTTLIDASLGSHFDSRATVAAMCERDVSINDIADFYVPTAARRLGRAWIENDISFAQVTVASGRLQEMLGALVRANDFVSLDERAAPNVLVVSLEGDHHTIGWKLVAVQLRRLGACAHAVLDIKPHDAADTIQQASYDLVLVSSSRPSVLEQIDELTAVLHDRMVDVPPIVLGGIVVDLLEDPPDRTDIVAVTNCLETALSMRKRKSTAGL